MSDLTIHNGSFDQNVIAGTPIKERKIWVKDNRVIIETDENGIVQSTITQCTVE